MQVDPKRTIRLVPVKGYDELVDRERETETELAHKPGHAFMTDSKDGEKTRLFFGCPGCGRPGSIRIGNPKPPGNPSWDIQGGTVEDPASLTVSPSIHCVGCCGWHGYLRNGIFESC